MSDHKGHGAFPDLPNIPDLPRLRSEQMTPESVLEECKSVLRAAADAVAQVENCSRPGHQLRYIRAAVIDIRRLTFVLQTLRSRVDGFDDWYEPFRDEMRGDSLMRYFVELRNNVEKRGLPGALAELYDIETGRALADVACFEDDRGLAVSGAMRDGVKVPSGTFTGQTGLRNFRLPDPPTTHLGAEVNDFRFAPLAHMALDYLESLVRQASVRFGGR